VVHITRISLIRWGPEYTLWEGAILRVEGRPGKVYANCRELCKNG